MRRRLWPAATVALALAVAVVVVGGRSRRHRDPTVERRAAPVGVVSPTGAAPGRAASTTVTTAGAVISTSTSTTVPAAPQVVAADVTLAYVDGPVSGRQARCRPYDTGGLDAQLGQPTWAGAGPAIPAAAAGVVSVGAPVLSDDTAAGLGYEITVSGVPGVTAAEVYVVAVAGVGWRAQSVSLS